LRVRVLTVCVFEGVTFRVQCRFADSRATAPTLASSHLFMMFGSNLVTQVKGLEARRRRAVL